ncbi:MAG: hypothetical protein JXK08_08380 [Flavobacteriaceae bacterium]|nr:hypothetical protein [Flavobacteriaceae bacterium]
MKLFYTYFIILTFVIRPIFSIVNYSYYAFNIDYIIETYCVNTDKPQLSCNGKCHLAKQLQATSDKTSKDNIKVLSETFMPVFFHKVSEIDLTSIEILELQKDFFPNSLYRLDVKNSVFKPPIV